MYTTIPLLTLLTLGAVEVFAAPVYNISDPTSGPIPGQSTIYTTDTSIQPPWPGNVTGATLNTTSGAPGKDDLMWQNLLSAEWVVFSFYQQAVEAFNETSFEGFPNTTYSRIREIRNNEAGHLRIFQDAISSNSIKPGPCKYSFPFQTAEEMLALATTIEVSSMAFLTGLAQQAQLHSSQGALIAVAETESRHNTWSLIDIWNTDPFAGPSDTSFPYANQILFLTTSFIVPGSCPPENPPYPYPSQHLPSIAAANGTTSIKPGSQIKLNITDPDNQLSFKADLQYYIVYFHGVSNISVPFDPKTNMTTIPAAFEDLGIIIAVVAEEEGAPTRESCVAGPLIILEQPATIGLLEAVA